MTDRQIALSVSNLEVRYGAALAVSGISFDVEQGSVLALLGSNGAGKSSVARACSGLVPPFSGEIHLLGENVTAWSADRIRRAGLIYVPEGRGVFPKLTVVENLRLAVRLSQNRHEGLERVFELFPILAERRQQGAGTLSGGEQQMLSMARVLAGEGHIAIVDEPSLGLAPLTIDVVFESLQKIIDLGLTIVIIEQFAHRALALSDQCIVLRQGTIGWSGPASEAGDVVAEHYLGAGRNQ